MAQMKSGSSSLCIDALIVNLTPDPNFVGAADCESRHMFLRIDRLCACFALLCVAGCSAVLENIRPTYEEGALLQAATRYAIEQQIGPPVRVTSSSGGGAEVFYRTTRLSHAAKSNLISGHIERDILTFGLAEITHPAFFAEDEALLFKVDYDSTGRVTNILHRCENNKNSQWNDFSTNQACANGFVPL